MKTDLSSLLLFVLLLVKGQLALSSEDIVKTETLIRNVSVWDGNSNATVANQDVLVEGNLIKAIGDTGSLERDKGLEPLEKVINGSGKMIIPGIIDAHVHLGLPVGLNNPTDIDSSYQAALSVKAAGIFLQRGWTTVRDMGGPATGLARAIDEGVIEGPRIYPSEMFISQTSGHGDFRSPTDPHPNMGSNDNRANRFSLIADGEAEVRRAVRESLRSGASQIKVMAGGGISSSYDPIDTKQYSLGELKAAVESAEDWNTYVAVHAYTDEAVLRALEAGVKVIEHGHLLSKKALKKLKSEGAFLSSQSFGGVRKMDLSADTPMIRRARQVMSGTDNLMSTAKEIGLPVAFGTDSFGSMRAYKNGVKEFGYRLRWFDSLEILKQATSHNAKLLELTGPRNPYQSGKLGVIEVGAYADMLIVEGNPLEDITLLEDYENNIKLIMKDGKVYKNTLQ